MSGEDYLQVFMVHDVVIARFKEWLSSQGLELQLMPRFPGETDETYTKTHGIVPINLDQILADQAAQHRKDHSHDREH